MLAMARSCFIFLTGSLILLASCATTTSSYQATVQSWQGNTLSSLEQSWGMPDQKLQTPLNTTYIYRTIVRSPSFPPPPRVGVSQNSKPIMMIINPAPTRSLTTCFTHFIANEKNTIIATKIEGFGCHQGGVFSNQLSNQEKKTL